MMPDDVHDISVESVAKVFGTGADRVEAIRSIDLQVRRGETVCVVGPSGCGKTTLLRMLLGLETPTAGKIWLDPGRIERGIAYVQQSPTLLPWRTAVQNAAMGLELRGRLDGPSLQHINEELARYGLAGFEHRLAAELSGGMKQRVELIRALESRPMVLLCDEPFSAIDFVTRLSLSSRFKDQCKVYGVTTVFVTHNIEEAIFLGDNIVVLSGRPSRVLGTYSPQLSVGAEDAVACRDAPEFSHLFREIWNVLKSAHAI